MEIGGLLAVALTAGALYAITLLVARGPETLRGGLFHAEPLGWPHGVQEDDDFRWHWSGLDPTFAGGGRDRHGPGRRGLEDAYCVPLTPVRPRPAYR